MLRTSTPHYCLLLGSQLLVAGPRSSLAPRSELSLLGRSPLLNSFLRRLLTKQYCLHPANNPNSSIIPSPPPLPLPPPPPPPPLFLPPFSAIASLSPSRSVLGNRSETARWNWAVYCLRQVILAPTTRNKEPEVPGEQQIQDNRLDLPDLPKPFKNILSILFSPAIEHLWTVDLVGPVDSLLLPSS